MTWVESKYVFFLFLILSSPSAVRAIDANPAESICANFLSKEASLKAGIYYRIWDPRYLLLRQRIQKEVKKHLPELEESDKEAITREIYIFLKAFEKQRPHLPLKGYALWAVNFAAPLVTGAVTYFVVPENKQVIVAIVSTYIVSKLLDPLGAAVQEKWNARLKKIATDQLSAFQSSTSSVNTGLNELQDRATGALTEWEDAGDAKLRNIELVLELRLREAREALKSGDADLAAAFAADAAVDMLTRWTYVHADHPLLRDKLKRWLNGADRAFRTRLKEEILGRHLIQRNGVVMSDIEMLLDIWMPQTSTPLLRIAPVSEAQATP